MKRDWCCVTATTKTAAAPHCDIAPGIVFAGLHARRLAGSGLHSYTMPGAMSQCGAAAVFVVAVTQHQSRFIYIAVFRALAPHEQARVRTVPVPAAAHAVMLQPMVPDAPRVITDPRLRTPDLDRGYVPPAPQPAVHSCSYCHKRYHPPDHCFRLYPHMQVNSRMGQSGSTRHAPARAHTVTAEEDAASQQEVGSWSMGGRWVSQDVRAQALATIPEQGASYCVITANAARAVPFTPKAGNAVGPVAATTTPMPMAAPIAYATTQLQAMAAQLQAVTDRLQHLEARVELLAPSTTNEAHAVAVPSRGAAVRAACHPHAPNQHLGYFSNTTVESGCAVADSEGQLHLLKAVMLDGGSDSCLISHECAAALNLPLTACSRRLSVASGAESMSTQLASLRVSLCYGTQHAMVLDLEAIVMPPGASLAYDLLLGANFLSQTKGLCDMYDREFAYCPRLHSHGDTRSTHRMPITDTKGCLALVAQNPTGTSQLLVACAAVSHSQDQPPACATSGATSLVHHTPGVHMHVETPLVAAGTTTPSAVSRGGDLAATEGASSRVATDDAPTPAGSGVKSVRSSAQPATRRGGGTASQSVLSSARDPAARRASQPSSAPQRSAKHLAVGTAAAQRVAKQQRALPPPSPLLPRRSSREVVWHTLTPLRLFLSFLFLLWLPAIVTSLPPPIPDPPSSAITCSVISMVLPDGPAAAHSPEQYTKLPNGVLLGRHAALSQQQAERMAALVAANPGAFAHSLRDLTGYKGPRGAFRISLSTTDPVVSKPRRYSELELQTTDAKVAEMLEAGIIRPVTEPCDYASAPVLPMKKDAAGQWTDKRFCVDYRRLNEVTLPDRYGLPLPEEMFARLGTARWFSKLDMRSGFLQLPVHSDDQLKTAFWARNQLYCFTRMPFGLRNASAEYQRVMDAAITSAGLSANCMAFIDDVLVYSDSFEAHCQHVQSLLQMLQDIGMFAHPEKSILATDCVEY
ncbi:hypothetical protein QJQ45_005458, partial [Haematococcus lacustris]